MKIILLPGLDGTGLLFKPFLELLPSQLDVITVAYPTNQKLGYGELTKLVLKQLPDDDFIIVAESFSGYIAYKIGLHKPPRLKKIIFVASFLQNPKPKLLNFFNLLPIQLLLKISIPKVFIKRYLLGKHILSSTLNSQFH